MQTKFLSQKSKKIAIIAIMSLMVFSVLVLLFRKKIKENYVKFIKRFYSKSELDKRRKKQFGEINNFIDQEDEKQFDEINNIFDQEDRKQFDEINKIINQYNKKQFHTINTITNQENKKQFHFDRVDEPIGSYSDFEKNIQIFLKQYKESNLTLPQKKNALRSIRYNLRTSIDASNNEELRENSKQFFKDRPQYPQRLENFQKCFETKLKPMSFPEGIKRDKMLLRSFFSPINSFMEAAETCNFDFTQEWNTVESEENNTQ